MRKIVGAGRASVLFAALVGCATVAPPTVAEPSMPPPRPATASTPPVAGTRSPGVSKAVTRLSLGWPIWIGIVCDDLEGQRRFYREVLGLKETNVGVGWIWFDVEGKLLELLARSERTQYARRGVTVGFAVADIHAARATLIERGAKPASEIEGGPDEYWAYFTDGEGNLFEIVQKPAPGPSP